MAGRPDRLVLVAFIVFVVFAGANAIGVRFVLREMGPFWAAAIRFVIAGCYSSPTWSRPGGPCRAAGILQGPCCLAFSRSDSRISFLTRR